MQNARRANARRPFDSYLEKYIVVLWYFQEGKQRTWKGWAYTNRERIYETPNQSFSTYF